ncbi:hypothetical protein B0H14DRAFT_3128188 [Mycena olivaceomarginata]|nr:hypothetical protein B0H14DRAFT_3128188 [Mycena olivaceomarginata]
MPPSTVTQNRLDNVHENSLLGCYNQHTTQAVLKNIQTVSKHKDDCVQLLEQIHALLNAIMILHIKSDAGGEMPIEVLDHVGKFIGILHKIYTFVEAQQKGNRVKSFFQQGEISTLLKDCQGGLQQSFEFFQIEGTRVFQNIAEMKKDAEKRHQEVLDMIEKLSEEAASHSNSISMLPSEPKIFHGRESELSDILHLFNTGIPRIAILGAGARYVQNRFFVACNSVTTGIELANLVGSHLGLKPGKNLTQAVLQYFANNPPSLLILDELETLWEPASSRGNIEELLSLLTDSGHSLEEVDQILSLADNMPLAISLLAHLADTEGCSNVLSRWDKEKTSVISEGFDKRSNLDMSISLSLSSPRIQSIPHSQELLSLLAMLPDGLTDVDLIQSKLPLENILKCKTTLKATALAYSDEQNRLKYMGTQSISSTVSQLKLNHTNIQNVLQWGLKQKQPTLSNSICCVCHFSRFSEFNMQVQTSLMGQIQDLLPQLNDHQLTAFFLIESIRMWRYYPISDPEALASQVVELFKDFNDPDLKCRFYIIMTDYHRQGISLATQTGNIRRHSQGLINLSWINLVLGAYSVAQMDARECQKLSRVSGYLVEEATAVSIEAQCWKELGHYKQSLSSNIKAQSLLSLCGMSGTEANIAIMVNQAEVHKCKSEYSEAWEIQTKILQISTNRSAYWHAAALLNLAEIAVAMGVQKYDVQRNIDLVREKDLLAAKGLFKKCLKLVTEDNEIKLFCFERLGNASSWGVDESTPGWTTIFLIHSLKSKAKLQVYKALQFLGQIFLTHKDENTAISLFTVALVGFTYMDVHRSRAECMITLGDISSRHGDLPKAVELWESARPLFERSSQVKEVQCVDERLSRVGSNVLDHHRENIARLVPMFEAAAGARVAENVADEGYSYRERIPLSRTSLHLRRLLVAYRNYRYGIDSITLASHAAVTPPAHTSGVRMEQREALARAPPPPPPVSQKPTRSHSIMPEYASQGEDYFLFQRLFIEPAPILSVNSYFQPSTYHQIKHRVGRLADAMCGIMAKQVPSTAQHDNEERGSYASTREWKWATFRRDGRCTALATVYVHASITCQHPPRLTQERHLPQFPPAVARPTPLLDSSGTRAMATGLLVLRGMELARVEVSDSDELLSRMQATHAQNTRDLHKGAGRRRCADASVYVHVGV